MQINDAITWLNECSRHFASLPTGGKDRAHWANTANAETAQRIAMLLQSVDKDSLTTANTALVEERIARQMLAKIMEASGSVDGFAESLCDHPEASLSLLADTAIHVVSNPYRFK